MLRYSILAIMILHIVWGSFDAYPADSSESKPKVDGSKDLSSAASFTESSEPKPPVRDIEPLSLDSSLAEASTPKPPVRGNKQLPLDASLAETPKPKPMAGAIEHLSSDASLNEFPKTKSTVESIAQLDIEQHLEAYQEAKQRLFLLDSDGTLRNQDMDMTRIRAILEKLAADPKNHVWILSARPVSKLLDVYKDIPRLRLSGEHGLVTLDPETQQAVFTRETLKLDSLEEICQKILSANPEDVEEWKITKNLATLMISYIKRDAAKAEAMEKLIRSAIVDTPYAQYNVNHIPAQGVINILPPNADKGSFSRMKVRDFEPDDFVISMGDDEPDEAMHEVVNKRDSNKLSVVVSSRRDQKSCAMYKLDDVPAVHDILGELSKLR